MSNYDYNTDYPKKLNDRGTFIVKIARCEGGTWQGKLTWAEGERTLHFRSALELIKMIDEAMAETMEKRNSDTEVG